MFMWREKLLLNIARGIVMTHAFIHWADYTIDEINVGKMSIKLLELKTKNSVKFNHFQEKRKKKVSTSFVSYAHISWHKCLCDVKSYFKIERGKNL